MRVLIASHYLGGLTGSETFWFTVADHLIRLGADVHCYARRWNRRIPSLLELGVTAWVKYEDLPECRPDVALVSHGPVAERIRKALPDVPMFFFCHGVIPDLEVPPKDSGNIRAYYAVSLEVAAFLQDHFVPAEKIHGPFQPVDSERFKFHAGSGGKTRQVLVVSSRMPPHMVEVVKAGCLRQGADVSFVGEKFIVKGQDELAAMMRAADVVISLGRGVIEGMMSGAVPIVYDYLGADGVVTPDRLEELAVYNFSGRMTRGTYNVDGMSIALCTALQTPWKKLRWMAEERYDAENLVGQLLERIREEV